MSQAGIPIVSTIANIISPGKPPTPQAPPPMPDPNSDANLAAKMQQAAEQQASRKGRASTLLNGYSGSSGPSQSSRVLLGA